MSSRTAARPFSNAVPRRRPVSRVLILALCTLFLVASQTIVALAVPAGTPAAHAAAALRRPVDASHPLLMMQEVMGYNISFDKDFPDDINKHWDIAQAWEAVPDDLKSSVAFVLHPGHNSFLTVAQTREWAEDNIAEAQSLGIPVLMLWGETPTTGSDKFTWIQHLYETYPNFIGTEVSELTSVSGDIPTLLQLANQYGGYHVQSSLEENNIIGSKMETASYYNSVSEYAQNFIFSPKDVHKNFDAANSEALGDWLSGAAGNWGPYFDAYTYYGCGIQGESSNGGGDRCSRSYPEEVIGQTMLDAYMQGATVYTLENQMDTPAVGDLYTPTFWQSVLPAFRYILAHPAPTKAQVTAAVKVVYSESAGDMYSLPDTDAGRVTFYEGLTENVPDIANTQGLFYYPRSSGRYYAIPRIPALAPSSVVSQFPNVITKTTYNANLQGLTAKQAYFNAIYPAINTGDAFVENIGSQYLIYNNHYSSSSTESAQIPLTNSEFTELDLSALTPDTYAMADLGTGSLHVLMDDYIDNRGADLLSASGARAMEFEEAYDEYSYTPHPADTTMRSNVLTVRANVEPTLTISGYDGHYSYTQNWNATTHVYTLNLSSNAAVDITLNQAPTDSGWTRADDAGGQIAYAGTWTASTMATGDYDTTSHTTTTAGSSTTYEFNGTSVEWIGDTTVAGGTADVAIDGSTVSTGVSTGSSAATGAVLFKATGLTNTVHTIRVTARSGTVSLDRWSYLPSQTQILNTVKRQDFSYATAATDPDQMTGVDGWTISSGAMKVLPYINPWFSDQSVYNTNASYSDFTYQADLNLSQATPAGLMFRASAQNKTGYYLMLDPARENPFGDTTVSSVKLYRDYKTLIGSAPTSVTVSTNAVNTVKIVTSGSSITVYLNGTQVISATDATYASGETGVRVESDKTAGAGDFVTLDNVSIAVGGTTSYSSAMGSWAQAAGWESEGALVFNAPAHTSFDHPYAWTTTGGTSTVLTDPTILTSGRNGVMKIVAATGTPSTTLAGSDSWSSQIVRSLVQVTAGSSATVGLLVRMQDATDGYEVLLNQATGHISLVKETAGVFTTITSGAAVTLAQNQWYEVGVQIQGDQFTVSLDGVTKFTARDSTYAAGSVGYALSAGTTAQVDDLWVATLPTSTAGAGSYAGAPFSTAGWSTGAKTLVGFSPVTVKTARNSAPTLPSTVSALYSDGTTAAVAVSWPTATSAQLAASTTPYAGGQATGTFTLSGTVSGTSLTPVATVTVMPALTTALTTTVTTTTGSTNVLPWSFSSVSFTDSSGTFTRTVYVDWNTVPNTSTTGTKTVFGTILDYPFATAKATVVVN
jgi:Glycosyl hydrolase family 98 C-terminal domain/Glycosyl hydrolase family 98/Bacterial Ig-like domain (group 4)/Domain of Unknown Function (DUF1080)